MLPLSLGTIKLPSFSIYVKRVLKYSHTELLASLCLAKGENRMEYIQRHWQYLKWLYLYSNWSCNELWLQSRVPGKENFILDRTLVSLQSSPMHLSIWRCAQAALCRLSAWKYQDLTSTYSVHEGMFMMSEWCKKPKWILDNLPRLLMLCLPVGTVCQCQRKYL